MSNVVAIFVPSLAVGGAEVSAVRLANSLVKRGVPVDFLVASGESWLSSAISPGVNVVYFRVSRVVWALGPLVMYLKRAQPVALLSLLTHANLTAILASRLSPGKTPVFVSERQDWSPKLRQSFKDWVMIVLAKVLYPFADGVHAVSNGVARSLSEAMGVGLDRITVIYNGLSATPQESEISREFGGGLETLPHSFILGAGRLVPQKGFSTLLEAFAVIAGEVPALNLVIAGEGPLRETLIRQSNLLGIGGRVHFPGVVRPLTKLMERAEVFVLTSRYEGFGNVLLEAMSAGAPVISSNCDSGPREILEDGKWGSLVPVGDVQAFAEAMKQALTTSNHPNVRSRAEDFSIEKTTTGFLKLLGISEDSP